MALRIGLLARAPKLLELFHAIETRAAGVAGGSIAAAGINVRGLNSTVTNSIPGASRTGAQVTLPAGTYEVEARSVSFQTGRARLQLFDVTNNTVKLLGMGSFGSPVDQIQPGQFLIGHLVVTTPAIFELHQFFEIDEPSNFGLGVEVNDGDIEIYAELLIWKV